jgi:hypothetical protein
VEGVRRWPSLALDEWRDTYATLHMWMQVVGKIRLAQTPLAPRLLLLTTPRHATCFTCVERVDDFVAPPDSLRTGSNQGGSHEHR